MTKLKIIGTILLILGFVGCSSTKVLLDISSNDFVKLNTFDNCGKSKLMAGISFRDSVTINNKKTSKYDKMYNSALIGIKNSRITYFRDDFSPNDNTIRLIDYSNDGSFVINGFAENTIKFDEDSIFETQIRTFDYIAKYGKDKKLLYKYTLENRNHSHTSNHSINCQKDFYYFQSIGDVFLKQGFIDHDKGNMNHSSNIIWWKENFMLITDYEDTDRYSNHKTGISDIILTNEGRIVANITDINSYKKFLVYYSDSLKIVKKIKLPSYSSYIDLKQSEDSLFVLGHNHQENVHLLILDKELKKLDNYEIPDSSFRANANKNKFSIHIIDSEVYVIGLIEISDRNSDLIIWSYQTGERIGYIPIENLDDIQYRIYKNKIFIGGNYKVSTIIADSKYDSKGEKASIVIRKNWR